MLLQTGPVVTDALVRFWAVRVCWGPLSTLTVLRRRKHRLYFWLLFLTTSIVMFEIYKAYFLDTPVMHSPPALLIESKKTDCLMYDDRLLAASANAGTVAIVGWHSLRTLDFLSTILRGNSSAAALLMTSPEVLAYQHNKAFGGLLAGKRWSFLGADTHCDKDLLQVVFDEKGVHSVHVVYDETDFLPFQSAVENGGILRCYVTLLDVLAKNKQIKFYLHLKNRRNSPVFNYDNRYDYWVVESQQAKGYAYDWMDMWFQPSCDPGFDYSYLYDVFLKTVDIYTTTYKNLYDMTPNVVISRT